MWTNIVQKMYEERDAQILQEQMRSVVAARRAAVAKRFLISRVLFIKLIIIQF